MIRKLDNKKHCPMALKFGITHQAGWDCTECRFCYCIRTRQEGGPVVSCEYDVKEKRGRKPIMGRSFEEILQKHGRWDEPAVLDE